MFREARRRLGRWRDEVLYGARNRALAGQAATLRQDWIDAAVDGLRPLEAGSTAASVEVHMMCGEGQAAMGLWSSYSLCRFLDGARFVLHSDGTLSAGTVARWRRIIPWLDLRTREESFAAMETRLAGFPAVRDWSHRYHFGLKLGGYYGAAERERIVEVDSDTLTFRRPEALLQAIAGSGRAMTWNEDEKPCYAYPEPVLREALGELVGPRLPARLNAGYMLAPVPGDAEWAVFETMLTRLAAHPATDPLRYWMHQTLWAVFASRLGDAAAPLPAGYGVHDGPTAPDAVMRHYPGTPGIRPRFFTEGVPMLAEALRREGALG